VERHFPRKRFGQHFLTDKNLLGKIVRTAGVGPGDTVLEIGPGRGALTGPLLDSGARVVAVEVDTDLARGLSKVFGARLLVVTGDVLGMSFKALAGEHAPGSKLVAVSNLPYNISSPVLFKLLEERESFSRAVLMLQKEVACRLASPPGTKGYGVLAALFGVWFEVKKEFTVSRTLFAPRPKVDSAVVSLEVLARPRVEIDDFGAYTRVVKAAFGTRRKTLRNALAALGLEKAAIVEALSRAGVDPARRAETLSLAEFAAVTREIFPAGAGGAG